MKYALSFRSRILLVVTVLAIFPLVLVGLWLTATAARSGEELLESRLKDYLDSMGARVTANWLRQQSDLLTLGEEVDVQHLLGESAVIAGTDPPPDLAARFASLNATVARATIRDLAGRTIWTLDQPADRAESPGALLLVDLPIHRRFPVGTLGELEALVRVDALFAGTSLPTVAGAVFGAFDQRRGTPLLLPPVNAELLSQSKFSWGGEEWLAVSDELSAPSLRLVAAAPLGPFTAQFEAAAYRGSIWLAAVALAGLLSAALITERLTRRLEKLASAAESVSKGDIETSLDEGVDDETGRVARAFNRMTANLRSTLEELAARERLAAVGAFAAELAHEVRNPLTAIRLNLQQVEECLPGDSPLRGPQQRALNEIERLDATVRDTLDRARGRSSTANRIDLMLPLRAAVDAALPAYSARNATLDVSQLPALDAAIIGNQRSGASLEQLFLNLLLNAAAALNAGGRAWLTMSIDDESVRIACHDNGSGIPGDVLPRVFEPLFTTRGDGTGLGLTVARRIAEEHGGRLQIESDVDTGTSVFVILPLASFSSAM